MRNSILLIIPSQGYCQEIELEGKELRGTYGDLVQKRFGLNKNRYHLKLDGTFLGDQFPWSQIPNPGEMAILEEKTPVTWRRTGQVVCTVTFCKVGSGCTSIPLAGGMAENQDCLSLMKEEGFYPEEAAFVTHNGWYLDDVTDVVQLESLQPEAGDLFILFPKK